MSEKKVTPYKKKKVFLDKKASIVVYAVTLVLAVVCRTIQLKTNMNFATGKYIDDSIFKNTTLWVLVIGFALTLAIMIWGESRDKAIKSCILVNPMRLKADRLNKKISPAAGISMLVMAVFIGFQVISEISAIASVNLENSTDDNPIFIFSGISLYSWIIYLIMITLVITFVSTGVNILKGDGITRGNCFFLMLFPIWKLINIFDMITEYQLIGPYSEKCYMLFTDMSSAMFILFLVRFFCGYEKKNTRLGLIMFGYIASTIAAVSSIPRYITFFTVRYSEREGMLTPDVTDIGIILMTITIVAVFWSTYVYRVMPKLNLLGKRRWSVTQTDPSEKFEMKSIDDKK